MSKERCPDCGADILVGGGMTDHKCELLNNNFPDTVFNNWDKCASDEVKNSHVEKLFNYFHRNVDV